MGKNSGVDWCDYSHGFWYGCRRVSPGCLNCYAERQMTRFKQDFNTVTRAKGFNAPLGWRVPGLVFVCPQSDFFIEDADRWRDSAWDIIRRTPHLTYLILTKRPQNISSRLPYDWPIYNVWLGVTAENQAMADKRVPILLTIPATVRFVSVEPMLERVDLRHVFTHQNSAFDALTGRNLTHGIKDSGVIDWVICGGETGPDARFMAPAWALNLAGQCQDAGTAFFMKQMSRGASVPACLQIKEYPKC